MSLTKAEFLAGLPEVEASKAKGEVHELAGLKLLPGEDEGRFKHLDPACPRPAWRDILAAYRATPSTKTDEEKLELVKEWSRLGGDRYTSDEDVENVWHSMPPKVGGVGAGTFMHLTRDYTGPTAGKNDEPLEEVFGPAVAALLPDTAQALAEAEAPDHAPATEDLLIAKLRGRSLLEWKDKPPLKFWDRGKTLPRSEGGYVGVLYGRSSAGKTTLILALIGEAIRG
jgi:hypothetical protein